MNVKQICMVLSFVCLTNLRAVAQQIQIGDKCPDVKLEMINYPNGTAKISDFRGKLLILDFWATWCAPCVEGFVKLDALQTRFGDKIKILPITYEDKTKADFVLNKLKEVKNINPCSVINDSILNNSFWHSEIPFYVWINAEGVIIAMSTGNELTSENIQKALEDEKSLAIKNPKYHPQPDQSKPFFNPTTNLFDWNGQFVKTETVPSESILFTSTFTRYRENAIGGLYGAGDDTRITMENVSINFLYDRAFSNKMRADENMFFGTDPNRIIWQIKDTALLPLNGVYADKNITKGNPVLFKEWLKKYAYCYEVQTPLSWGPDKKYEIMVNDLNRYFGTLYGLQGSFEKRINKSWALIRTSKKNKLSSIGGPSSVHRNPYSLGIQNSPLSTFVQFLGADYLLKTVSDKTGIEENVDLEINIESPTLSVINKELGKYDLKLVETKELQNVIVIRQIGKNNMVFSSSDNKVTTASK